jgi:predicted nucleic acid-binding protein
MKLGAVRLKAYLDANILISYVNGPVLEPKNYPKAKRVWDEIKEGKYKGVVSTLVLQEVLSVFRRMKGQEIDILSPLSYDQRNKYVSSESQSMFSELLKSLMRISTDKIIFENCDTVESLAFYTDSFDLYTKYFGEVRFYQTCNQCKSETVNSTYKGLAPMDIIHIMLANRLECDSFITLDKGYSAIINEPKIKLKINVW